MQYVTSPEIGVRGEWAKVKIVAVYTKNNIDLAIVSYAGKLDSFCLAKSVARLGTVVTLASIRDKKYAWRDSRITANSTEQAGSRGRFKAELVEAGIGVISGESGGAILNKSKQVVGIIVAGTDARTVAVDSVAVRRYVSRILGRLPSCGTLQLPQRPKIVQRKPPVKIAPIPPRETKQLQPPTALKELQAQLQATQKEVVRLQQELSAMAARQAKPLKVRILTTDGKLVDEKQYKPGETIDLYLVPQGSGKGR